MRFRAAHSSLTSTCRQDLDFLAAYAAMGNVGELAFSTCKQSRVLTHETPSPILCLSPWYRLVDNESIQLCGEWKLTPLTQFTDVSLRGKQELLSL